MTTEPTILDALIDRLQRAAAFNTNDEVAPLAVLWPDPTRQWETVVPRLRERLPVLTLGAHDEERATGAAIWLRTQLAAWTSSDVPVIYLPGIKRADLQPTDHVPDDIALLVYLQGAGTIWLHPNGREWTVFAFLQGSNGGLELPLDGGNATRDALQVTLPLLLERPVAELTGHTSPITAAWLLGQLFPDLPRSILKWLDNEASFREGHGDDVWQAFTLRLKDVYSIDLTRDSAITAARALGEHISEPWRVVWQRWCEAPQAFPHIPDRLRSARPTKSLGLFASSECVWPQDNESAESTLRTSLAEVAKMEPAAARQRIIELDSEHGSRRKSVWASLNQAPLAEAMEPLRGLASATEHPLPDGNVASMIEAYTTTGWRADEAALDAITAVQAKANLDAVAGAVRAMYLDWLTSGATDFQTRIATDGAPRFTLPEMAPGTCLLFADGLRFDIAQRLAQRTTGLHLDTTVTGVLGPLPGVTPTAKPAVSPVAGLLAAGSEFNACPPGKSTSLTKSALEDVLRTESWTVLSPSETTCAGPTARAWTELGDIDSYGHNHGLDLAREVDRQADRLAQRIADLLAAGWQRVVVVTDHGWLLMPGGLPKSPIPLALTEGNKNRKGRCARLSPGATTEFQTVPWHWDSQVRIAVAPGISCFREGVTYEHGGLSPQECIVPIVTVGKEVATGTLAVAIDSITWRGLRCIVKLTPPVMGLRVDIRSKLADPTASLVAEIGITGANGQARVFIADSGEEGNPAAVIVADQSGMILTQQPVIVGGDGL